MYTIIRFEVLSPAFVKASANVIDLVWRGQSTMFRECLSAHNAAPNLAQAFYVVAMAPGSDKALGFCMSEMSNISSELRSISWAVVDPNMQRMGIGEQMVEACIEDAALRGQGVMLGTQIPDFFQKMGFETIGYYAADRRHIMQYRNDIQPGK